MNDLVQLRNDEAVCNSLDVAKKFNKEHSKVIRSIEQIRENSSSQNWLQCFNETSYKDESGKNNKMYLMNRDGFAFLVMGFTGKKAMEWKWKYIEAFNKMESIIREKSTQMWISAREAGKLTRKSETDVIKELIEYAKSQGSSHSDKLYIVYSNLANKMAGVKNRDEATVQQLGRLDMAEQIILCMIREGMAVGLGYKDIYQNCKERLELVKELAYLGVS